MRPEQDGNYADDIYIFIFLKKRIDSVFTEVCLQVSNWPAVSFGSEYSLEINSFVFYSHFTELFSWDPVGSIVAKP